MGAFLVAPISTAGASHDDGTYDIPVWFRWDTTVLDVIVVPPSHGPIYNNEGALDGNDPSELTPVNSYLAAIEDSAAGWDRAVEDFGAEWLKSRFVTNLYVAGRDEIPDSALADPEIVIVSDEWKANVLGISLQTSLTDDYHSRPCIVDNSKFFVTSFTYADMYNIGGHEFGHCLGVNHVVDTHPEHELMAATYADGHGQKGTHLHCVSNLDVLALESGFGAALGRPSPDVVSIPAGSYGTTSCQLPSGRGIPAPAPEPPPATPAPRPTATPTPTPGPTVPVVAPSPTPSPTSTPAPSPTPAATSEPTPTPASTTEPEPTPGPEPSAIPEPTPAPEPSPTPAPAQPEEHTRSVDLRLRRHLVARGTVASAAEHCVAAVDVTIEKRVSGAWRAVTTAVTTAEGRFRVRIADLGGRYRAVVERVDSDLGACGETTSATRRHAD